MSERPLSSRSIRWRGMFSLFTLLTLPIPLRFSLGCSDSTARIAPPTFDASTADATTQTVIDGAPSDADLPKTIATSNAAAWVKTGNTDTAWTTVGADETVTYDDARTGKI